MKWQNIQKEKGSALLVVWQDCAIQNDTDILNFNMFFENQLNIKEHSITHVGCVTTLADRTEDGKDIPGTGGRQDFFFWLDMDAVPIFLYAQLNNMIWWADVYFKQQEGIYPQDFLDVYPDPCIQEVPFPRWLDWIKPLIFQGVTHRAPPAPPPSIYSGGW